MGEGLRHVEHDLIQERHSQLQRVSHVDLVGLHQNVAAHPGEKIQVLHSGDRVHILRLRVDRRGDLAVIPLGADLAENSFQLLVIKGARVAVVAILHRHGATLQQRFATHALG